MVVKVHQFKSDLTISPFAPSWNFIIAEKKIDIDVDNLSRLILDKASPEYEITNAPNCKSSYHFGLFRAQGRPDARSNKFRCHFGSVRVPKEVHILQMASFGIILVSI